MKAAVRSKLHELCRQFPGAVADVAPDDAEFDAAATLTDRLLFIDSDRGRAEAEIIAAIFALENAFDVDVERPAAGPIRMSILGPHSG
jgi:hypothetical protein